MSKNRKKKLDLKHHTGTIILMLVGGICGVIMSKHIDSLFNSEMTIGKNMISLGLNLIVIYLLVF